MKLMPALPETIFDVAYLIFAITTGIVLLTKAKGRTFIKLFGTMALILGSGDSFHLVPRVLNYWTQGDYIAVLGVGKLVTSITMTVFYLLFEYARRYRYKISGQKGVLAAAWILSGVRIALCCFPQNEWTSAEPSLWWGIIRNIPFAVLGVMTVVLWFKSAKNDKPLNSISSRLIIRTKKEMFTGLRHSSR